MKSILPNLTDRYVLGIVIGIVICVAGTLLVGGASIEEMQTTMLYGHAAHVVRASSVVIFLSLIVLESD